MKKIEFCTRAELEPQVMHQYPDLDDDDLNIMSKSMLVELLRRINVIRIETNKVNKCWRKQDARSNRTN